MTSWIPPPEATLNTLEIVYVAGLIASLSLTAVNHRCSGALPLLSFASNCLWPLTLPIVIVCGLLSGSLEGDLED